ASQRVSGVTFEILKLNLLLLASINRVIKLDGSNAKIVFGSYLCEYFLNTTHLHIASRLINKHSGHVVFEKRYVVLVRAVVKFPTLTCKLDPIFPVLFRIGRA